MPVRSDLAHVFYWTHGVPLETQNKILKTLQKNFHLNFRKKILREVWKTFAQTPIKVMIFFEILFKIWSCVRVGSGFEKHAENFSTQRLKLFCSKWERSSQRYKRFSKVSFTTMFLNLYNPKFWFCWMLKLTFLHNYMVEVCHQLSVKNFSLLRCSSENKSKVFRLVRGR